MDNELRALQRSIQAGDDSLIPAYIATLRRMGLKPKLRPYHTRELGISVRPDNNIVAADPFGTQGIQGVWIAVQRPKGKYRGELPLWQCKHKHKTTKEAGKCAKRRGYCLIIHDDDLLQKYIDINKS